MTFNSIFLANLAFAQEFDFREICYDEIGCFTNEYPWCQPGYRPDLLPWSPADISPRIFFSSDDVTDELLKWNNPEGSFLRHVSHRETIIAVHGWTDYYDPDVCDTCDTPGKTWINKANKIVRKNLNSNFVGFNWANGAAPFYDQAVQNCRSAGRIIAFFLNQLVEKYNFDPSKFYCAGHSLGGHVCAYAGKYSQEAFGCKMGRITGLDPAGPLFTSSESNEIRLHHTDAEFVDAIHCEAGNVF